jgi:putative SOS response-associated peptidase YedK
MCGRFTLTNPRRAVSLFDGIAAPPDLKPRYNVAPTQTARR